MLSVLYKQLSVTATDRIVRPLTDVAQVVVNLRRDQFPPEFNPRDYSVTIDETYPVNDIIVLTPPLNAVDRDVQVRDMK